MPAAPHFYGIRYKQEPDIWMNDEFNLGSKVLCALFNTAEGAALFLASPRLRRGFRENLSVQPIERAEVLTMVEIVREYAEGDAFWSARLATLNLKLEG
jgi:hypothetical protein